VHEVWIRVEILMDKLENFKTPDKLPDLYLNGEFPKNVLTE
jgi:hypothetical protein